MVLINLTCFSFSSVSHPTLIHINTNNITYSNQLHDFAWILGNSHLDPKYSPDRCNTVRKHNHANCNCQPTYQRTWSIKWIIDDQINSIQLHQHSPLRWHHEEGVRWLEIRLNVRINHHPNETDQHRQQHLLLTSWTPTNPSNSIVSHIQHIPNTRTQACRLRTRLNMGMWLDSDKRFQ